MNKVPYTGNAVRDAWGTGYGKNYCSDWAVCQMGGLCSNLQFLRDGVWGSLVSVVSRTLQYLLTSYFHKDLSVLLQFRDSYSWNVQESFPLDRACPEVLDLASWEHFRLVCDRSRDSSSFFNRKRYLHKLHKFSNLSFLFFQARRNLGRSRVSRPNRKICWGNLLLLHLIGSNQLTWQVASQPAAADRVACGCQTDVSMPTMANRLVQSTVYPTVRREWVWSVVFGALNSPISTTLLLLTHFFTVTAFSFSSAPLQTKSLATKV